MPEVGQQRAFVYVEPGLFTDSVVGYVAALIVCPEIIPPSEWLPEVWSGEHEFVDVAEAEATTAAVMEHYNRIAKELVERPEEYAPVLEIDPNSGETLWEPWIDGFERAMRLQPDAWFSGCPFHLPYPLIFRGGFHKSGILSKQSPLCLAKSYRGWVF